MRNNIFMDLDIKDMIDVSPPEYQTAGICFFQRFCPIIFVHIFEGIWKIHVALFRERDTSRVNKSNIQLESTPLMNADH